MHRTVNRKRRLAGGALLLAAAAWAGRRVAAVAPDDNALAQDGLPFYTTPDLRPRWRDAGTHQVGNFSLRNQRGETFDQSVLDDGPTVLSFFFTGCATVCPVGMELLNMARRKMGADAPGFLSITVTPRLDDSRALQQFAARTGLPLDWRLATGDEHAVFRLAREDLFTDIETPGPDNLPPHTERALLIDAQRRIRGIYNATVATELLRLKGDVRRLRGGA